MAEGREWERDPEKKEGEFAFFSGVKREGDLEGGGKAILGGGREEEDWAVLWKEEGWTGT